MRETSNRRRGSCYNATKHGIFAGILLRGVSLGESEEAYHALLSGLRKAINPTDEMEDVQVEKLAFLYLRSARAYKADWNAAPKLFEKVASALDEEEPFAETQFVDKKNEVLVIRKGPAPDLLLRYEANIERQIARTLSLLEQWRRMRDGGSGSQGGP